MKISYDEEFVREVKDNFKDCPIVLEALNNGSPYLGKIMKDLQQKDAEKKSALKTFKDLYLLKVINALNKELRELTPNGVPTDKKSFFSLQKLRDYYLTDC